MDSLGQVTASELKARGWTETMIRRLLGTPCATARNPYCPTGRPMRLYQLEKVSAVEARPEFRDAMEKSNEASARASAAHRAKTKALVEKAWRIPIALPEVSDTVLKANARERIECQADRQRMLPFGLDTLVAGYAVQVLLDACEPSLWVLDAMFATPGVRAARLIVRKRILAMVAAKHPWLKQDCIRRFRKETGDVDSPGGLFAVA